MNIVILSGFLTKNIELVKLQNNEVMGKFQLQVITRDNDFNWIDIICFEQQLVLNLYEKARKGFELSVIGEVKTIKQKTKYGNYVKRTFVLANQVTIHTARYDNALNMDEFIERYAPENVLKKIKKAEEKAKEQKEEEQEKEDLVEKNIQTIQVVFKD